MINLRLPGLKSVSLEAGRNMFEACEDADFLHFHSTCNNTQLITLFQDEAPKEVTVAGRPASVRNLQVKDTTGRVKVALWRDLANSPCKPGDYVAITHAVLKTFNNEVVLQTTQHTKVEVSDQTSLISHTIL